MGEEFTAAADVQRVPACRARDGAGDRWKGHYTSTAGSGVSTQPRPNPAANPLGRRKQTPLNKSWFGYGIDSFTLVLFIWPWWASGDLIGTLLFLIGYS